MKITQSAINLIKDSLKSYKDPIVLIYNAILDGWWGKEQQYKIKMTELKQVAKDYNLNEVSFKQVSLKYSPCPVYIQNEIRNIIDLVTIDTYQIGMFSYLKMDIN